MVWQIIALYSVGLFLTYAAFKGTVLVCEVVLKERADFQLVATVAIVGLFPLTWVVAFFVVAGCVLNMLADHIAVFTTGLDRRGHGDEVHGEEV